MREMLNPARLIAVALFSAAFAVALVKTARMAEAGTAANGLVSGVASLVTDLSASIPAIGAPQ